jgi:hypothetical protein
MGTRINGRKTDDVSAALVHLGELEMVNTIEDLNSSVDIEIHRLLTFGSAWKTAFSDVRRRRAGTYVLLRTAWTAALLIRTATAGFSS